MGLAFHTIPGYAWSDWTIPAAQGIPAGVAALGGDGVMLQQQFDATSQFAPTPVRGVNDVSAASLQAMAVTASALGLKVGYKPHVGAPKASYWGNQTLVLPSGRYTEQARFTNGSDVVGLAGHGLDSSWVGAQLANPNPFHFDDGYAPTGMDAYGTTRPTWVRIVEVLDADTFRMSRAATTSVAASSLAIAKDEKARGWFDAYKTLIDDDMAALAEVGVTPYLIDIAAEKNYMTIMYPALWRAFIAAMRVTYPTTLLVCGVAGTSVLFASCTFYDALDFLSISDYPRIQPTVSSDATAAEFDAAFDARVAQYQAAQSAWRAKGFERGVWLAEIGSRTRDHAGYRPDLTDRGTYEESSQALFVDSFLRRMDPHLAGWAWWTTVHANPANHDPATGVTSEVGQQTYSITGKAAAAAHRAHKA